MKNLSNVERKYLLAPAVAVIAFAAILFANIFWSGRFIRLEEILELLIACVLPVVFLVLVMNGQKQKAEKPMLIAGAVLLGLQVIGIIWGMIAAITLSNWGIFAYIPGAGLLGAVVSLFRNIGYLFTGGFLFHAFRSMMILFGNVVHIGGQLLYLASNLAFLLVCSECIQVPPQVSELRKKVYEKVDNFELPNSNKASDAAVGGNAAVQQPVNVQPAAANTPFAELLNHKNIALCILLSVVTCGIYGLVWQYAIMKKIRLLNQDTSSVAGEFLCFVFVPFYSFYWYYTRAAKLEQGARNYGVQVNNNGVLYLLLAVFGVSLVNVCLIQNDLNTVANRLNGTATTPNIGTQAANEFNAAYADLTGKAASGDFHGPKAEEKTEQEDVMEQLQKLSELHDKGILTDEEFQAKKEELLKRI